MRLGLLLSLTVYAASIDPSRTISIHQTAGRLPIVFEPNHGQTDPQVRFLARGRGYQLFLTEDEAVFAWRRGNLRMCLEGARQPARFEGLEPTGGVSSYFRGDDPRRWRTAIPHYTKVRLESVYPNIDLVYYSTGGDLEYDFILRPGGDPRAIRITWQGADSLEATAEGDLLVRGPSGAIRQRRPRIYQELAGRRVEVAGGYRVGPGARIAFDVGAYDPAHALVIDPVLVFSTYLGGAIDFPIIRADLTIDSAGNIYLAGAAGSMNYPATAGAFDNSPNGGIDAVVSKLNAAGTALIFATYLGGSELDIGRLVAADSAGEVYLVGDTLSPNFPTSAGAFDRALTGFAGNFVVQDGFVTKLNASGTALIYSTFIGGSAFEQIRSLAVDAAGNAWIAGRTHSSDFPTTADAIDRTFNNPGVDTADAFVMKLNSAGTAMLYGTYMGGSSEDEPRGLVLDSFGNVYVCGYTSSADFPATPGAFDTTLNNPPGGGQVFDGFVFKLNAVGSTLVYSTYIGGNAAERLHDLAVEATGSVYLTGWTQSPNFPVTTGAYDTTHNANQDVFVAKLNGAGSGLVYSTFVGGSGADSASSIAIDANGRAYVTGETNSANFPVTEGAFPATADVQILVIQLNATGASLTYSTTLGAIGPDNGNGIAVDSAGDVYVGGTATNRLPAIPGSVQSTFGGAGPYQFVFKIDLIRGVAASISAVSGGNQSGAPGTRLANPLVIRLVDARGAPVSGASITLSAVNAIVSPPAATTDASGNASIQVTLGMTVGPASVTVTSGAASATFPFSVGMPPAQVTITSVVNGASFLAGIQDGSWTTITGTNLSATTRIWDAQTEIVNGILPTSLDGVSVTIDGKPAAMYFISGRQLNVQTPITGKTGTVEVVVTNAMGNARAVANVVRYSPALFLFDPQNRKYPAALIARADGGVDFLGPAGLFGSALETRGAKPLEVVLLFGTAFGPTNPPVPAGQAFSGAAPLDPPDAVTATVGGVAAQVQFAGLSGTGLYQINLVMPDLPPGEYKLVLTIRGLQTQDNVFVTISSP